MQLRRTFAVSSANFKFHNAILIFLIICWKSCSVTAPNMHFTKLYCNSLNTKFVTFNVCRLRAIKGNLNEVTIRMHPLQPPVDNVTVILRFMKKTNGYTPYHADVHVNACKFLETYPVSLARFVFEFVRPYSNVNHTCPYDHDIIVDRMRVDRSLLSMVPIPTGDYAIFSTWLSNDVKMALINLYFQFNEK